MKEKKKIHQQNNHQQNDQSIDINSSSKEATNKERDEAVEWFGRSKKQPRQVYMQAMNAIMIKDFSYYFLSLQENKVD